jgi:hypothetical protein
MKSRIKIKAVVKCLILIRRLLSRYPDGLVDVIGTGFFGMKYRNFAARCQSNNGPYHQMRYLLEVLQVFKRRHLKSDGTMV